MNINKVSVADRFDELINSDYKQLNNEEITSLLTRIKDVMEESFHLNDSALNTQFDRLKSKLFDLKAILNQRIDEINLLIGMKPCPQLPNEIWLKIFSKLPQNYQSNLEGPARISKTMRGLAKYASKVWLESEAVYLQKTAHFANAKEAINFIIKHELKVANLKYFKDLILEDLERLAANCPNLEALIISDNDINSIPLGFANLRILKIIRCKLTDSGLLNIKDLKNLQVLSLFGNDQITDGGLGNLKDLINLQMINLNGCLGLTGVGFVHFKEMKNLHTIDLGSCMGLVGTVLANLNCLKNLCALNLGGCHNLESDNNVKIAYFKGSENLDLLDLRGWKNLQDSDIEHFKSLKNLHTLCLARCPLITSAFKDSLKAMGVSTVPLKLWDP